jgi:hypothetical protein
MKKIVLAFVLLAIAVHVFPATRVVPLDLFKPFRIRTDGEKIFIGQEAQVFIYSTKDYKLLTTFGKAGEGPQEFKLYPEYSPDLDVHSDMIVATSIGKVSHFTKDGKFVSEKKVTGGSGALFFRQLGDKFLGESILRGADDVLYVGLHIYDSNFNKTKEVFRYKYFVQRGKQYSPIERGIYIPNFFVYDNKIFIGGAVNSGSIHVFDAAGKPLYTVKPKLDNVKFTEADKQGFIAGYTSNSAYAALYERRKKWFKYPGYFPLYEDFIVADGRIYVQTFKRDETDTKNEFYIFTLKGELIKRVWLPLDEYLDFVPCPYIIGNKTLYQCVDNEDAERWELHVTPID